MQRFFYPHLALSNIRKNKQIYIPYLLTSAFTVMMFYVVHSLSINTGLNEQSTTAPFVLSLGKWVVSIFSFIFLFYMNSFLMKRRKKEVALYNILGMEKKHVMIMMLFETIFTSLISLFIGIVFGAVFSKLMLLLLVKLCGLNTGINFEIPFQSILWSMGLYGCIFFMAYLFNVVQIKVTNPIELLKGGQTGEKEPRTKMLMTIIGILTLGSGYIMAQTIEDPLSAMLLFFVAVILVIIGTYFLFTAGSIVVLKVLKKNKHFYYKTNHFISVSQMIYRMKQNAVGLASICILCTCILVMLSSTVTLYLGVVDTVKILQTESYKIQINENEYGQLPSQDTVHQLTQRIKNELQQQNIKSTVQDANTYFTSCTKENSELKTGFGNIGLSFMTLDEYNRIYNKNMTLKDNEIFISSREPIQETIVIDGKTFTIKSEIDNPNVLRSEAVIQGENYSIVFANKNIIKDTLECYPSQYTISINYDENDAQKADQIMQEIIAKETDVDSQSGLQNYPHYRTSQYENKHMFIDSYGSLFFLGIFLGILFLMATILIMYYKQLSEGYEDQKRYEIMQNVGMSKKEVKQAIRCQVLIFFFLPLVIAVIHMAFAFKMITKMFGYLILSGQGLFIWCTIISALILAIIYSLVYALTARTYYKLVKN